MKRKSIIFMFVLIASLGILSSCSKKDGSVQTAQYSDLSPNVKSFISEATFQDLTKLGIPMYPGTTPPNITNAYFVSPYVLVATNIVDDYPVGSKFYDFIIQYSNLNTTNSTVRIDYDNVEEVGSGIGGYIAGNNNYFTVYAKIMDIDLYQDTVYMASISSGQWTSTGIKGFYYALLMIDDSGDTHDYYIKIGEGRVIYDQDGFSEITSKLVKSATQSGSRSMAKK
jgi:hypothetical protein